MRPIKTMGKYVYDYVGNIILNNSFTRRKLKYGAQSTGVMVHQGGPRGRGMQYAESTPLRCHLPESRSYNVHQYGIILSID